METREQWQAAYDQAENKEQFIAQYGDGSNLPSQAVLDAEARVTTVEQGPEVGYVPDGMGGMKPQTLDPGTIDWGAMESQTQGDPIINRQQGPHWETDDNEQPVDIQEVDEVGGEVTDESIIDQEQQQHLKDWQIMEKAEKQAEYNASIAAAKRAGEERTSVIDSEGNILRDLNGNPIRRELSSFEKIDNSMQNMVSRVRQLVPNIELGVGTVMEKLIPKELWDDYTQNGENSQIGMIMNAAGQQGVASLFQEEIIPSEEDVNEAIQEKQIIQAEQEARGEVGSISEGIKEGDIGELAAGLTNAASSFLPSMLMAAATGGTSTGFEFFGDMYVDYNDAKAKRENKSIEQLRAENKDSFTIPAVMGAVATASELFGLQGAANAIKANIGKPIAKKVANVMLSGNKEGLTELFQTGLESANLKLAETDNDAVEAAAAFGNAVFSEEGLESYLQGFAGGAGFSGGGSVDKQDLNNIRKAAAAMRAPEDTKKIHDALAKKVQLNELLQETQDPDLQSNYQAQIEDLDNMIKGEIIHANGFARKMDDTAAVKAAKLADKRAAVIAQKGSIEQKFKNKEITLEQKNEAIRGIGSQLKDINRQEQQLRDDLAEQPNIRDKKGEFTPNGLWNSSVKQNINKAIETKGAEGAWDVIQDPKFQQFVTKKVAAVWNKMPTDIQQSTSLQDVVSEVMMGGTIPQSQTVVGTFKAYKPEGKAAPASYFLNNIDNKITGAIQALTQQGKQGRTSGVSVDTGLDETGRGIIDESQDTIGTLEDDTPSRPKSSLEVAENLGVGAALTDQVKAKMEALVGTESLPAPTEKGFEKAVVERFRGQLDKPIKAAMGKGQDYVNYITNNAEQLIDMMPKRSLAKKRNDPAQAWATQRPTVQEFIDYMLPTKGAEEVPAERGVVYDDQGNEREVYKTQDGRIFESDGNWNGTKPVKLKPNEEYEFTNGESILNIPGKKDAVLESKRKNTMAGFIGETIGTKAMHEAVQAEAQLDPVQRGFKNTISALEKMLGDRNALNANILGVPVNLMIGAVRTAELMYNGGKSLAEAIDSAMKGIQDFGISRKQFMDYLKMDTRSWNDKIRDKVQGELQELAQQVEAEINPDTYLDNLQESDQIADDDFAAQSQATDKILQAKDLRKTYNSKDPADYEAQRQWTENVLTKEFPQTFFQQGMFANAGSSAAGRGYVYTSKQDIDDNIVSQIDDPARAEIWNKTGRYIYGNKDINDIKKNWGKIKENNANNWAAFEDMWNTFDKMIKEDSNNAPHIAAFLKGAQNSQNHISRTAAQIVGYSDSKGGHARFEEEHATPQSAVSRYLIQGALEGKPMDQLLKNVKRNFIQIALNKNDDLKLKKKGEYNYASKMPEGWRMSDSVWARYFNPNVNANNGGIDPNSITFFDTGKTVAETFGAGVDPRIQSYPTTLEAQQNVVAEQVGDRVEQFLDTAINGLESLAGPKGALQANIAAVPLNIVVGGLRATKLAYRGARNLANAIEAGYQQVKDYMSRQEWADFTSKAIKEVKNEKTPAQKQLVTISKNALKLEKKRQQTYLKAKRDGLDVKPGMSQSDLDAVIGKEADQAQFRENNAQQVGKDFDNMFAQKKLTKLGKIANEIFIGSSAEDFKGLMYRVTPGGKANMDFIENNFINPYLEGVEKMKAFKATNNKIFAKAAKGLGRQRVTTLHPSEMMDENAPQDIQDFTNAIKKIDDGKFFDSLDTSENAEPIAMQMINYFKKDKRQKYLADWNANVDAAFRDANGKIKPEITERLGKSYSSALDNMLGRMKTGTNRQDYSVGNKEAQKLLDFVNFSNSVVMQWNMRSAALQMLSSLNYMREAGLSNFNFAENARSMAKIANSTYLKERFGNKNFELDANEIAEGTGQSAAARMYRQMMSAGFTPTATVDALAIITGGAPYYTKLLKQHKGNEELAMRDFIKYTEENQQSSDPSKISKLQAGSLGRIMYGFLNTPFQYARLSKRAIQDIRARRGSIPGNLSKLAYFTFIQSAAFSMLQNMLDISDLFAAFDDEEDDEDFKVQMALDGWVGTNLKTLGTYGTIAEWARNIYNEFDKQSEEERPNPEKMALSALKILPPASRKISDLKKIAQYNYKQNKGKTDQKIKAVALAGDLVNLPTYRLYQKIENLAKLADEDRDATEKLLRFFGWTDWALGKDEDKESNPFAQSGENPFAQSKENPFANEEDSPFKFMGGMLAASDNALQIRAPRGGQAEIGSSGGGPAADFNSAMQGGGMMPMGKKGFRGLFGGGRRRRAQEAEQMQQAAPQQNQMEALPTPNMGGPSLTPESDAQNQMAQQVSQMNTDIQQGKDDYMQQLDGIKSKVQEAGSILSKIGSTPLMKLGEGELGQAHDDGTIEVDPSLSPAMKRKVIAHEQQHVDDMKNKGLGYTDKEVTFDGKKYPRKDGKILYNGKWLAEGDKSFPWEKRAYAAEKQASSPMKKNGPGKKKKKKKGLHSLYAPGYTKHFQDSKYYAQGFGGSEGGQGGLVYQHTRPIKPGKKGSTAYTAGALQNSYGDPIALAGVGREWKLGKKGKTKVGIHGGATYGYGKSYNKIRDKMGHEKYDKHNADALDKFTRKTNVGPLVTGSIERDLGGGFGAKAIVNPMYVNAGLTYNFGKKKKRKKKK